MSLADWKPSPELREQIPNRPPPTRMSWTFCTIRKRPTRADQKLIGCVEDCGQWATAETRPWCPDCHRMWHAEVPF